MSHRHRATRRRQSAATATTATALAAAALLTGCAQSPSTDLAAAEARARDMAAQADAPADLGPVPHTGQTGGPLDAPRPAGTADRSDPGRQPRVPPPQLAAAATALTRAWSSYPWPANVDGKACPPPRIPTRTPNGKIVVVLGDSLVREAMPAITTALQATDRTPVFVCWGGKTLAWGTQQIRHMKDLGVLPQCLVVNLGTNDVKNEAATPTALRHRLRGLLTQAADVDHVGVVNLWANTATAPTTMRDIAGTLPAYRAATRQQAGLIDWSTHASARPDLVGTDGVHDSTAGELVRADAIRNWVLGACH